VGAQKIDEDALLVLLTRHAVGYAPEADRATQSLRVEQLSPSSSTGAAGAVVQRQWYRWWYRYR
jgi:hypothetical protein